MEFQLGYRREGFGLGYPPSEIEEMPVAKIHWMYRRLVDQREAERKAVDRAIAEARRGR